MEGKSNLVENTEQSIEKKRYAGVLHGSEATVTYGEDEFRFDGRFKMDGVEQEFSNKKLNVSNIHEATIQEGKYTMILKTTTFKLHELSSLVLLFYFYLYVFSCHC